MKIKESLLRKIIKEELAKTLLSEAGTTGKDFLADPERYMKMYLRASSNNPKAKELASKAMENVKKATNDKSKYAALKNVLQDFASKFPRLIDISDLADMQKDLEQRAANFKKSNLDNQQKSPPQKEV